MTQATLEALRDIHPPAEVSIWPLAPGWWLLITGVILLGTAGLLFAYYRRQRRLQRAALQELKLISSAKHDDRSLAAQLSMLLRRYLVQRFPERQLAAQTAQVWLQTLDSLHGGNDFSRGIGRQLISAPYAPQEPVDRKRLICLVWQLLRRNP